LFRLLKVYFQLTHHIYYAIKSRTEESISKMKQEKLNITRLAFSKDRSVGDLRKESSEILRLSGNYVYLLCSDGCENPYDDELIQHKLDYYFDTDFVLNYKRVFSSQFYQKLRIPNDYTILKVYDVKTLNFVNVSLLLVYFSTAYFVSSW